MINAVLTSKIEGIYSCTRWEEPKPFAVLTSKIEGIHSDRKEELAYILRKLFSPPKSKASTALNIFRCLKPVKAVLTSKIEGIHSGYEVDNSDGLAVLTSKIEGIHSLNNR